MKKKILKNKFTVTMARMLQYKSNIILRRQINLLWLEEILIRSNSYIFTGIKSVDNLNMIKFYEWFVGFSDAESSFWIQVVLNTNNSISKITWVFSIELHKDDYGVLVYIKDNIGIGTIRKYKDKCIYTVTSIEGTKILISIFDKYNLNSTKYLDYLNYKEAFMLYTKRDKVRLSLNRVEAEDLTKKILELKNTMNTKRNNIILPKEHNMWITINWLLGYIEGDGSFFLSRTELEPIFSISASEEQLFLFEKIKVFLENNLGFDKYSQFKLNETKAIGINKVKARETGGKPSVILSIKNIKILNNYLIPKLDNMSFITKKGLDYKDFKIIVSAVYKGSHKIDKIKSLILNLSYSMNNFRLSTYNGESKAVLSNIEKKLIINAPAMLEYLKDGRVRDINKDLVLVSQIGCIYEIKTLLSEIILLDSLKEVLNTIGVSYRTLKKKLDIEESSNVEINGYTIKRIAVFQP